MTLAGKRRITAGLLVVLAGIAPSVIQHQTRTRAPENERAARFWPSEVYHMAIGATYLLRADCPDTDHRGPKPPEAASTKRMRDVLFNAKDDDAAARFVSERFAGCRYSLVGRV